MSEKKSLLRRIFRRSIWENASTVLILVGVFMLIPFPLIAWVVLYGGIFGLPVVETSQWGGFTLTLVVSLIGIIVSLPLGILLALGRRSNMPIIHSTCLFFIEFFNIADIVN